MGINEAGAKRPGKPVEYASAANPAALNELVSALRVSDESIAGIVKGGLWKVLRVPGA